MSEIDAFSIVFGDLEMLAPSSKALTLDVLRSIDHSQFKTIVDIGCGTGEQTLVLAKELNKTVHAIDTNSDFLTTLQHRAAACGLSGLVTTHCIDMKKINSKFSTVDLLWSEGAAYSIGFAEALNSWSRIVAPTGAAVVSELCWVRDDAPDQVVEFFNSGYPQMRSVDDNRLLIETTGFRIEDCRILPPECWHNYYDGVATRAESLLQHENSAVRQLAIEMVEESRIYSQSDGSYSYALFTLRPSE